MDEYHWTLTYEGDLVGTGSVTARDPFEARDKAFAELTSEQQNTVNEGGMAFGLELWQKTES